MTLTIENTEPVDGLVVPVTRPEFHSISDLLKRLPPRGVGVLWGHAVQEEFNHYRALLGVSDYNVISNGQGYSVRMEAVRLSPLYARTRYKVESFIWRSVPATLSLRVSQETTLEFKDVFDFAAAVSWQQLVQYIKPRYAATRRVKEGIDDDIQLYLAPFRNRHLTGDVVTRWRTSQPSYEDLVLLWMFYHSPGAVRLVVLTESKQRWFDSPSIIEIREREYIRVDDLIDSSGKFFGKSARFIRDAFEIWSKGVTPAVRALIKAGTINESSADVFLRSYAPLIGGEEGPGLGILVPTQQTAPLRFQTSNDRIDILDEREYRPEDGKIVGGSVACLSALDDLESYTGFENVIPTFRTKTSRIRLSLQHLQSGSYDDNIVVQLGVEVDLLESRISAASDTLSDTALAESATFFPRIQGLLRQFSVWESYTLKSGERSIDSEATQAAVEVLSVTPTVENVFTGRAKDRIRDYVTGVSPDVGDKDLGAVTVVENIAAQAADAIAQEARANNTAVSASLARSIKRRSGAGPAKWMVENRGDLATFAESGRISWLKAFLSALSKTL